MLKVFLLMFLTFLFSFSAYADDMSQKYKQDADKQTEQQYAEVSPDETDAEETLDDSETDADRFGISMEELEQEKGVYLEEGFYQRSAVSYLDALMVLRGSYNVDLNKTYKMTMDLIHERLHLGRFDYVPLPEPVIRAFVREANSRRGELTPESLIDLIENHLLPEIKKVLEETIDIRAAQNVTDAQKQTMIAVKAKEIGLTEGQLIRLMNSAYIYIPTITSLTRSMSNKTITYTANLGVVWYQVMAEKNEVVVRKKVFPTATIGTANRQRTYLAYGGPDNFALHSALSAAVNNLVVGTKEIPDFSLSGQLVEKSGRNAKFEVGTKEGLEIDDKFVFKMLTDNDGVQEYKEIGFGFVSKVGKNSFEEDEEEVYNPSSIKVLKDNQFISPGIVAFEYPRLGIDLDIRYQGSMASVTTDDSTENYLMHGLGFHIYANVGKFIGISQMYLKPFGLGFGFGPNVDFSTGTVFDDYSTSFLHYQFLGLQKKFYIARAAVSVELGPEVIYYYFNADNGENLRAGGVAFYVDGGLEYALLKNLNFKATGGINFGGEVDNSWQIYDGGDWRDTDPRGMVDFSKPRFSAALVWSVGKLPFDPWSMLKSYIAF